MLTFAWPKGPTYWLEGNTLFISIPFTWNLPEVRVKLMQSAFSYSSVVVGGPAVKLMPGYFSMLDFVREGDNYPGVLQKVNPLATHTTTGCIRHCKFCGIGQGKIEQGGFKELDDWPDLPLICDNNLLASSVGHFDKVIDRLKKWRSPDFNQGLDIRLLNEYHARRFAELKQPKIRLACDDINEKERWTDAVELLLQCGVRRSWISTYALIGFDSGPDECWQRCEYINQIGTCNPMWFHSINDVLPVNSISPEQLLMGWTSRERIKIMRKFYKAKFGGYVKSVFPPSSTNSELSSSSRRVLNITKITKES